MAVLCSQCGALLPRPDLSRTPLVCARCATARASHPHDDEDMLTVDAPPPERASESAPTQVGASLRPSMPPSVRPPPGPTSVPRPSVRPPVGGPPGSRIPGGGSRIPRASAAPRPSSSPGAPSIPKAPAVPALHPGTAAGKPGAPAGPAPRPRPVAEPAPAQRARQPQMPEWDPDDEPTGDILLETGDFESLDPSVPRPRS